MKNGSYWVKQKSNRFSRFFYRALDIDILYAYHLRGRQKFSQMVMEKKTPKPYGKSIDSLQFLMGGYGSKKNTNKKTSGKQPTISSLDKFRQVDTFSETSDTTNIFLWTWKQPTALPVEIGETTKQSLKNWTIPFCWNQNRKRMKSWDIQPLEFSTSRLQEFSTKSSESSGSSGTGAIRRHTVGQLLMEARQEFQLVQRYQCLKVSGIPQNHVDFLISP